jgi:HTH-type transcriptional regulator, glycine betaine synthesis regulator
MNQPYITTEKTPTDSVPGLSRLEIDTIDIFVRIAHLFGVSKSVGEIYGLLFISALPLPLDYIRTKLSMSSGSASQGLRLLRSVGAVRTAYVPGDRRDHFLAETALQKITNGFLREKFVPNLMIHEERLQRLSDLTAEIPQSHRPLIEDRIRILQNWRKQARAVLPIMMSGLETGAET